MRNFLIFFFFLGSTAHADTIKNYMNIANSIPQMEVKADSQAQAWARSARTVLAIASESIGETMTHANELAQRQGSPLFCLPTGVHLDSIRLNELIQQTYKEISSQQSDKDSMTVSQVAWVGVTKQYPCQNQRAQVEMEHIKAVS
jgi:uncharacterized protein YecT (DUF1311 family)